MDPGCQGSVVPPAFAEQVGIAICLFRAGVLHQPAEQAIQPLVDKTIRPLSDPGILVAVADASALARGLRILGTHSDSYDPLFPAVRRIVCFLGLLKEQKNTPDPLWEDLVAQHDHFASVVDAIAWCPAYREQPFDVQTFAKIVIQSEQFRGSRDGGLAYLS